jgi:2-polyprenyl-3-methyl-5-hydroxy-6-metoxy-1,4-benzoquinol methylase
MNYTDEQLQDHELNFWINDFKKPFYHEKFYKDFYNFDLLKGKKVLDIGCGGYPVCEYTSESIELTILDPLIDKLILNDKYNHLDRFEKFSGSILDYNGSDYDVVVCLNVIDHFNDKEFVFVDKFNSFLKNSGELWLYYDVRPIDCDNHLALDSDGILNKLKLHFDIIKIDETTNPTHVGWSKITKSIRLIAKKK